MAVKYDPKEDLYRLAALKRALENLENEKAQVEARLVESLQRSGHKSLSADIDGVKIKGTLCAPTRVVIDEARLKASLDAAQWKKVTSLKLDKEKLEAAVVQNIVDRNVVAAVSDELDSKPYIRVSGKIPDDAVSVANSHGQPKPAASKRVAAKRAATVRKVRPKKIAETA